MEQGIWLLPLVLLLASTGMRKGWLGILVAVSIMPRPSAAFDWSDVWLRRDQQGANYLRRQQPEQAAELFEKPIWRGMALFQSWKFEQAAAEFARVPGAKGHYNRGNALAHAGHLQAAIAAYKDALTIDPQHTDAAFNLKVVEDLLKQNQPPKPPPPKPKKKSSPPPAEKQANDQQKPDKPKGGGAPEAEEPPSEGKGQSEPPRPEADDADAARRDAEQQMKHNPQPGGNPSPPTVAHSAELPDPEGMPDAKLDQWLRQVPDDPSGLLRRKFMLEHLRRKNGEQTK